MTLYPNTRPAESWEQCAAHLELWGPHGGPVEVLGLDEFGPGHLSAEDFRTTMAGVPDGNWRLRWPDPPHPGLHSPEVMTEDPTTEPCPKPRHVHLAGCPDCNGSGRVTVPVRSFVAWHTLGATIPEGWEWRVTDGRWVVAVPGDRFDMATAPVLVREPLTPPDPPCPACRVGDIYGDEQNHTCGRPEPVRVDPPEGAPDPTEVADTIEWAEREVACYQAVADRASDNLVLSHTSCGQQARYLRRLVALAAPARVEPPSGVQVIGWTEPTDDEPRALPIVKGRDVPDDPGWVRRRLVSHPDSGWLGSHSIGGASISEPYAIRPVAVPPAPETERVRPPVRQYTEADVLERATFHRTRHNFATANMLNLLAFLLPLDGTDGD
jgi:hypothetical protein